MKTLNLHDTLRKYNETASINKSEELVLDEAKSIISNAEADDIKLLTSLGMTTNIIKADELNKEIEETEGFPEVYDISTIKKLAINYRLRFLISNLYVGTIDPQLPSTLKAFIETHKITEEELVDRFYILAPAKSFKLSEKPKDPIMFYKINDRKFAFVKKWGSDFSITRLFKMFLIRTSKTIFFTLLSLLSIFMFSLYSIIGVTNYNLPVYFVFPVIGIFLSALFSFEGGNISSSENWNSSYI